jgi:hypothetical protein
VKAKPWAGGMARHVADERGWGGEGAQLSVSVTHTLASALGFSPLAIFSAPIFVSQSSIRFCAASSSVGTVFWIRALCALTHLSKPLNPSVAKASNSSAIAAPASMPALSVAKSSATAAASAPPGPSAYTAAASCAGGGWLEEDSLAARSSRAVAATSADAASSSCGAPPPTQE